jgi:creatinine amidohydrolase
MSKYFLFFCLISYSAFSQKRTPEQKAIFLEDISWTTAREVLNEKTIVVIPLGAGSKEHGPHLPLSTDFLQATALTKRISEKRNVIIAPTVNYGFYPAFLKYPGSTSTTFHTAAETVIQVVRSLAAYGPKKFYIINIGVSTSPTLYLASKTLAEEGILLVFSRYDKPAFEKAEAQFRTKSYSGHADEIETSNVLSVRPDLVNMKVAVNDSSMKGKMGAMTPIPVENGNLNQSGINGYAALGSAEKGMKNMEAFANELINEIDMMLEIELPKVVDRKAEYAEYEGVYKNERGDLELVISQRENRLEYILNGRDLRNFFSLFRDDKDYFSSMYLDLLFLRNDLGMVNKIWARNRGEIVWLKKIAPKN